MNGLEIEYDEETGELTITVHDASDNWTYRHEYGRLTITVPKKEDEGE